MGLFKRNAKKDGGGSVWQRGFADGYLHAGIEQQLAALANENGKLPDNAAQKVAEQFGESENEEMLKLVKDVIKAGKWKSAITG